VHRLCSVSIYACISCSFDEAARSCSFDEESGPGADPAEDGSQLAKKRSHDPLLYAYEVRRVNRRAALVTRGSAPVDCMPREAYVDVL
jgi:hypothetical protein